MQRSLLIVAAITAAIVLCLTMYTCRRAWLWQPWNPRYTFVELRGKTEQEVVGVLGEPYYIGRVPELTERPVSFLYTGAVGMGVSVDFDATGHVYGVRDASK